ncbi:hypothetical protein [Vibrio crassostreae]|uniref:hypothetical protein n=1 Tax=Vibrio crassostreae TaxID=246167 RepID=UPI001B301505|nr:hypothetical protein [Vibrio crassostreae]
MMKPLMSAVLSLLALSTCANAAFVSNIPKNEVDVFISSGLLKEVPIELVEYKLNRYLDFEESFWNANGIRFQKEITDVKVVELPSTGVIQAFNSMIGVKSSKLNAELLESIHNPDRYTVIFSQFIPSEGVCAMSTTKKTKLTYSVVGLDLAGDCSASHIFTHELSHQDGLEHVGEDDGMCLDGSLSLMVAGYAKSRNFLYGHKNCPSTKLNTPYNFYNNRIPTTANNEHLRDSYSSGVYKFDLYKNELYIAAKDIKGFVPKVDGRYFAVFTRESNLLNGYHQVELKRVSGGLGASLSKDQVDDLAKFKQVKEVIWVSDESVGIRRLIY